ncbi:IS30 family transposase [Amedibacillus sp. YH-ame6]
MKSIASDTGTTVSNIYSIIIDAKVDIMKSNLTIVSTLSSEAAFNRRSRKHVQSNISILIKAEQFINIVINEVKAKKLSSIDEVIHDLILNRADEIQGMSTVCTKTFYHYVHQGKMPLMPLDLPRMCSRRNRIKKTYIPKAQKGTSITERPFDPKDRIEFGHWEGDLIVGGREGGSGALLTLLERKTRMYYMIPLSNKTAKQVYMKINILEKLFGSSFSKVFKSITFDNGGEFARHKDIEKRPTAKEKRTTVYFGRPYRSCDRASNENCNGLVRYFIPKGHAINTISNSTIQHYNDQINDKKRKILGYKSAKSLFNLEIQNILELS